jgi:ribosomal-protein-serine acetyltransferase
MLIDKLESVSNIQTPMIDTIKVNSSIYLKRISHTDAQDIFDLIDTNRAHLRIWLPFVDTTISPENTHAFIDQLDKPCSREMVFVIYYEGSITGLVGFKDLDKDNQRTEIGYWLSKQNQGKGIITQSCKAIINKAFRNLSMNRIQIKCGVGNTRSSKIPKNLGFTFEGIEREGEKHRHTFIDLEVYSLLKNDWKKMLNKN